MHCASAGFRGFLLVYVARRGVVTLPRHLAALMLPLVAMVKKRKFHARLDTLPAFDVTG
jgi:hypothetical protein